MGAVDAHHVHPGLDQVLDELGIGRRLTRHADHDAHEAALGIRSQQGLGVLAQPLGAGLEVHRGRARVPGAGRGALNLLQDLDHGVEARQGMRLQHPERRAHGTVVGHFPRCGPGRTSRKGAPRRIDSLSFCYYDK